MDLRTYLKEHDLTEEEFGKRVGASQPSINRYASGERPVPIDVALRIEKVTKRAVTVEDLAKAFATAERARAGDDAKP